MSNWLDPTDTLTINIKNDIIRLPGSIKTYGTHSIEVTSKEIVAEVWLDGTGELYTVTCSSPRFDIEHFEPSPEEVRTNGPENFTPFNIFHLYEVNIKRSETE